MNPDHDEQIRSDFIQYLSQLKNTDFIIDKDAERNIIGFILSRGGVDLKNMIAYFQSEIKLLIKGFCIKPDNRLINAIPAGYYISYPISSNQRSMPNFSNLLMNIYFLRENNKIHIYNFEISDIKKPSLGIKELFK